MKLTLEVGSQIISIEREVDELELSIHSLIVGLIAPALRAAGYLDVTIDEVLAHDADRGYDELAEAGV